MNLAELREKMVATLSEEDVRTLAFDMGEDYENLEGERRFDLIRELVAALVKKVIVGALLVELKRSFPAISWPEPDHALLRNSTPVRSYAVGESE